MANGARASVLLDKATTPAGPAVGIDSVMYYNIQQAWHGS